mmetsp:Transcript_29762/g.70742  ORF Transcript_29762/g.70742 Transcript_29762/m.70742 type:complete len:239 (+) Transcript_29762:1363-2079(+)
MVTTGTSSSMPEPERMCSIASPVEPKLVTWTSGCIPPPLRRASPPLPPKNRLCAHLRMRSGSSALSSSLSSSSSSTDAGRGISNRAALSISPAPSSLSGEPPPGPADRSPADRPALVARRELASAIADNNSRRASVLRRPFRNASRSERVQRGVNPTFFDSPTSSSVASPDARGTVPKSETPSRGGDERGCLLAMYFYWPACRLARSLRVGVDSADASSGATPHNIVQALIHQGHRHA